MNRPLTIIWLLALCLCFLVAGCSQSDKHATTSRLSFDTSYTAPGDWKLLEEPKWGVQFRVPPTLLEVDTANNSGWVHEGTNLRLIVEFGVYSSPDSLKRRPNYSEVRLQVHGLSALVCEYDQPEKLAPGSFKKAVALFFLEKRKQLGGPEPSYRVEYASDNDRELALQILQTVHFYDS